MEAACYCTSSVVLLWVAKHKCRIRVTHLAGLITLQLLHRSISVQNREPIEIEQGNFGKNHHIKQHALSGVYKYVLYIISLAHTMWSSIFHGREQLREKLTGQRAS